MGEHEEHDAMRDVKAITHRTEQKNGIRRQETEEVISGDDEDEDHAQQQELRRRVRADFEEDGAATKKRGT